MVLVVLVAMVSAISVNAAESTDETDITTVEGFTKFLKQNATEEDFQSFNKLNQEQKESIVRDATDPNVFEEVLDATSDLMKELESTQDPSDINALEVELGDDFKSATRILDSGIEVNVTLDNDSDLTASEDIEYNDEIDPAEVSVSAIHTARGTAQAKHWGFTFIKISQWIKYEYNSTKITRWVSRGTTKYNNTPISVSHKWDGKPYYTSSRKKIWNEDTWTFRLGVKGFSYTRTARIELWGNNKGAHGSKFIKYY